MESKKKLLVALAVIILGVVNVHISWEKGTQGIFMENIEALAEGESSGGIGCYMSGSVVCPLEQGAKVKLVIE
ncbi:hypothetical protein FACS189455_2690 [Bacteroidia bacterium]|nr:hypothetical protein FACS189455_2690 [Bacteroidia bacterium]